MRGPAGGHRRDPSRPPSRVGQAATPGGYRRPKYPPRGPKNIQKGLTQQSTGGRGRVGAAGGRPGVYKYKSYKIKYKYLNFNELEYMPRTAPRKRPTPPTTAPKSHGPIVQRINNGYMAFWDRRQRPWPPIPSKRPGATRDVFLLRMYCT